MTENCKEVTGRWQPVHIIEAPWFLRAFLTICAAFVAKDMQA